MVLMSAIPVPFPRPALAVGSAPLRVLIVGGGASGVLLAAQLMRKGAGRVAVRIVEKADVLGCGVAYSTRDPAHLLNTRVANMSAYPQFPAHFLDWLRERDPAAASPEGFVSRSTYGRYMAGLLEGWAEEDGLSCQGDECVALEATGDGVPGVVARLASGAAIEADLAVLATGHVMPVPSAGAPERPDGEALLSQPWADAPPPRDAAVLIVGSGLTMVDQVLSLLEAGHEGPVAAVSRRGLLPQVHAPTDPLCWRAEDLPLTGRIAPVMRWLRAEARKRQAQGGDWRDAVDGLRPHLQAIWRGLPPASRRTFLRHASSHWEVHRHRMPPSSYRRLALAQSEGRLYVLRARFEGASRDDRGRLVAQLRANGGAPSTLAVDRIVDCRGIRRDPETHATPLVADLLARGLARIDSLRIGLDVGPDCALLDREGTPSGRLFAMGPASRAAFWEITAIPDIRAQAARLADRLLEAAPG